jgi:hypothetical protein
MFTGANDQVHVVQHNAVSTRNIYVAQFEKFDLPGIFRVFVPALGHSAPHLLD